MEKIWDIFDEEKEKKEEKKKSSIWDVFEPTTALAEPTEVEPIGATLTTLPSQYKIKSLSLKEEYEKKAKPEIPSYYGISDVTTPEKLSKIEKGIIGLFGTWEAKKRAMPELQQVEDFGSEVLSEANKWAEELKGEDWKRFGSNIEQIAIIYEKLTGEPRDEALTEIKSQKDLNIFFVNPPEKYKEAVNLQQQLTNIHMKVAEPGKDIIGQFGWTGLITMMGWQILPLISKLPSATLNKIAFKVEGKTIKGKELVKILQRVRMPKSVWPEAGFGEPSKFDKKVFAKFVEEGGFKSLAERMKGITITEVSPRFAFGGKLYAGVPIDEMVKSIVSAGKLTQDIANQLKVMNPADTGLVFQQLSMASPAIASKLASQFVKLMPQKITKIPKVEEEMTPEEAERFEKLKEAKIIPEEEVEPTKVELEEIEKVPTPKEKFMAKIEEVRKAKELRPLKNLNEENFKRYISGQEQTETQELFKMKDKNAGEIFNWAKNDAVRLEAIIRVTAPTAWKGELKISELLNKSAEFAEKAPGKWVTKEYRKLATEEHSKLLKNEVKKVLAIEPTKEVIPEEIKLTFKEKVGIKPEKPVKTYDLKKEMTTEQKIKGNKLIGQIHKVVNNKGLTKVEFTALKRKYGLSPHLATFTRMMTVPQLEAVLKAVNRARPKIVEHKHVITPKTEKKIQSLKENLIDKLQMSEEKYQEVLKSEGVYKEPKYVDGKHFITETKGKEIIYRLIDEANILRSTLPYDKAVEENPVIKKIVDREKATISRDRDKSMKDPKEWNSMRVFAQKMEEITGVHVYRLYEGLIDVSLENKEKLGLFVREFHDFKEILGDEKALKRVTDYIGNKSNLKDKPEYPKNITNEEVRLAKKIEDRLKKRQAEARTQKFLDNVAHPEDMPQYLQYKKEVDKAKDIYESKGYDNLVEYMETQVWGIIKNGYDPDQVWSPRIRLYKPAPQTFGKHNIKTRTDIEYKEQDKNIIERLFTYERSMDNLVRMRPKVKALITLVDQNLDKFSDPKRVQEVIEVFLRELKGYNKPEGLVERTLNRVYAQAMQTIIMPSLVMFGRNCLQNLAFGYDKTIIIDPRNKKLSEGRRKFLETYISQIQAMKVDWFMIGEKPLPGLAWLTKIVNKVGIYPYSDQGNRHLGFWGKINQVDRGFKGIDANSTEKQISKAIGGAKFDDIERTERIMALEILAKDGYETMARYVSRCYVADTEFQYNRAERSPMEMGRGKWLSNLMLFPRSFWELLLKMGNKFKKGDIRQKARAFKVLVSIIVGGLIVGEGYKKVTGRRENPYNPLVLLAYEPGGLAIGTVEAFSDVVSNTIMAINGSERAVAALTTAIPRLSDMMIPFYDYTLRAIEATVPMTYRGERVNKRIDVLALRVLRKLATERMRELGWNVKGYKPNARGYHVERNFYQKLQYIIAGAGVDVGIKEEEKKRKAIPKSEIWGEVEKEIKSDVWGIFETEEKSSVWNEF